MIEIVASVVGIVGAGIVIHQACVNLHRMVVVAARASKSIENGLASSRTTRYPQQQPA